MAPAYLPTLGVGRRLADVLRRKAKELRRPQAQLIRFALGRYLLATVYPARRAPRPNAKRPRPTPKIKPRRDHRPLYPMDSMPLPRYVDIPIREVTSPHLSDAHFRTLAQLHGLADPAQGGQTPPLTVNELAALRGVSRAALFTHLRALRAQGYIQTELTGGRRLVVHVLHPEPGGRDAPAGMSLRNETDSWEDGVESLNNETLDLRDEAESLKNETLNPQNGTLGLKNETGASLDGAESLKNETLDPQNRALGLKNAGESLKHETFRKNGSRHDHVVEVEDSHEHRHEEQHLHEPAHLKNETGLRHELASALAGYGLAPGAAQGMAAKLLKEHGADVCARQWAVFEQRCELARASKRGLRSPIGLLCASIRDDWPLPAAKAEKKESRWYTDEEFDEFFEH